jgi:hypothetical protein
MQYGLFHLGSYIIHVKSVLKFFQNSGPPGRTRFKNESSFLSCAAETHDLIIHIKRRTGAEQKTKHRDFITSPTENDIPGSAEENLIPVVPRTGIVLVPSCNTISLVFSSSSF